MREFNVVVLGAGGVGKSALTVRFVRDEFVEHYNPTIEEEYQRELLVDGETSLLHIIDTAGVEQFSALHEVYIKSGRGFVLVFSLIQEASLKELENMRQLIYQIKSTDTNIPIVVVGTKMDLANEREVSRSAIQTLAANWNLPFYETSAKKNWHVSDVFLDLTKQMRRRYPPGSDTPLRKLRKKSTCVLM